MIEKFKEDIPQLATWTVAFIGVSILVGLGKLPPGSIEYLLAWAAGRAMAPSQKKQSND